MEITPEMVEQIKAKLAAGDAVDLDALIKDGHIAKVRGGYKAITRTGWDGLMATNRVRRN